MTKGDLLKSIPLTFSVFCRVIYLFPGNFKKTKNCSFSSVVALSHELEIRKIKNQ